MPTSAAIVAAPWQVRRARSISFATNAAAAAASVGTESAPCVGCARIAREGGNPWLPRPIVEVWIGVPNGREREL